MSERTPGSTMLQYLSQVKREEPCRASGSVQPLPSADAKPARLISTLDQGKGVKFGH